MSTKKTTKKTTKKKAAAKKSAKKPTRHVVKKAKRKSKPAKKAAAKKKTAAARKNRVPKGTIPLKLKLGTAEFNGYLKPLPQLGAWGGPEAFDIVVKGQPQSTISHATGAWVIQDGEALPQQVLADIINTILVYYNNRGLNPPMM